MANRNENNAIHHRNCLRIGFLFYFSLLLSYQICPLRIQRTVSQYYTIYVMCSSVMHVSTLEIISYSYWFSFEKSTFFCHRIGFMFISWTTTWWTCFPLLVFFVCVWYYPISVQYVISWLLLLVFVVVIDMDWPLEWAMGDRTIKHTTNASNSVFSLVIQCDTVRKLYDSIKSSTIL